MSEEEGGIEELHSRKQALWDLTRSEGWRILKEIADEQIEHRKAQELAFDIESSDDLYELTKLKAERRALILMLDLPETMIESLTEEIEEENDG